MRTRKTRPGTIVDRKIQDVTPDAENVVDHATDVSEDGPGHQNLHGGGHEAETVNETQTASIDVEDHETIRVQGEDVTMMMGKVTDRLQSEAP